MNNPPLEWPAILRWMIEGCLDWQDVGLIRPKSVIKASADYLANQDTFGAAFAEWIAALATLDLLRATPRPRSAKLGRPMRKNQASQREAPRDSR